MGILESMFWVRLVPVERWLGSEKCNFDPTIRGDFQVWGWPAAPMCWDLVWESVSVGLLVLYAVLV